MTAFPFLAVSFIMKVFAVLFVICSVALVLVVLIQKGRGGGLSGAFGGGMASGILGSKTGDFLTWITIVLVGVFLVIAAVMAKYYRPQVSDFGTVQQQQQSAAQQQPVPVESPGTATGGTSDSNAAGGMGSARPAQPPVTEKTVPVEAAEPVTGEANAGNDVNLPGK